MRQFLFVALGAALIAAAACSSHSSSNVLPGQASVARSTPAYTVHLLGSLGGTNSAANSINQLGWAMGLSFLKGNTTAHAAMWKGRAAIDLETLGGPNSAVEWPVSNDRGFVSGISETSKKDPLGESPSWSCHAFLPDGGSSGLTCLGFVWHDGVMRALPTLGGNNGYAAGMNESGVIAGWAETSVSDSTCVAPQQLQFVPVTWNASTLTVQQLPTLTVNGKLDPDGAATAVNRSGEVVGISGICDQAVGRYTAQHAVVWNNGALTQLQTIGGKSWNTPTAINDTGQIAGFLNQPGAADDQGAPNFISVIWNDPSQPPVQIGALPGDQLSEPTGINNSGTVLGVSFPSSHVFVWNNGSMTDVTALASKTFPAYTLVSVGGIDDRGEIAGQACELVNGACPSTNPTLVAFLAKPNR